MSEPKHEYGYLYDPPDDVKDGDECFCGGWALCTKHIHGTCNGTSIRRRIQPGVNAQGQECEIVGLDEIVPDYSLAEFTLDGVNWKQYQKAKWNNCSVREFIKDSFVLAIRRPKQQVEKVRYWKGALAIWKQDTKQGYSYSFGEYKEWQEREWVPEFCKLMSFPELTPQQAAEIIGHEAVFGKKYANPVQQAWAATEPKPVETDVKGINFMQTICASCGLPLDLQKGIMVHVGCTQKGVQTNPQWKPVSQCDLKPGEAFWYVGQSMMSCIVHPDSYYSLNPDEFIEEMKPTHIILAEGQYQIPKPPVVEKASDDGFEEWYKHEIPRDAYSKELMKLAWLASRETVKGKSGGR